MSIYSDDGYLYNANIHLDDNSHQLKDSSTSTYITSSSRKLKDSYASPYNQGFESIAMQENSSHMETDSSNVNLPSIFSDSDSFGSYNPPSSSQKMPHSPPRHHPNPNHLRQPVVLIPHATMFACIMYLYLNACIHVNNPDVYNVCVYVCMYVCTLCIFIATRHK